MSPMSCFKSVYFDIAQNVFLDDESWMYHVERDGSSYPIFATKGACHRNPISSRHQLLDQLS